MKPLSNEIRRVSIKFDGRTVKNAFTPSLTLMPEYITAKCPVFCSPDMKTFFEAINEATHL